MIDLINSWYGLCAAIVLIYLLFIRKTGEAATGGNGRVVGIVGRMGSGKSYFAVRTAWRRINAGANIVTNFTMVFDEPHDGKCPKGCTCKLRDRWQAFTGWEMFAYLEDAVVIIDEAHLWAPSNRPWDFPTVAKWKLAMARKFRLDLYWISQHEDRVARTIRDLTNMLYLCSSWGGGIYFTAKGWEPEVFRRATKHVDRKGYFFNAKIANLYDTLEVLETDTSVHGADELMQDGLLIGRAYNKRRRGEELTEEEIAILAKKETIFEEQKVARAGSRRGGTVAKCSGVTLRGDPCRKNAVLDGLCMGCLQRRDGNGDEPRKGLQFKL
jgi:hypothetical protein